MKGWVTTTGHRTSHEGLLSWKGKLQLSWVSDALVNRARKAQFKSDRSVCTTCVCGEGKEGCSDGEHLPDWSSLGGLQPVIRQLKEMVILPLLYPDLYQQMGISAPRSGFVPAKHPAHPLSRPCCPLYSLLRHVRRQDTLVTGRT